MVAAERIRARAGRVERLRRRLQFRAWRRGTVEADFLLGSFADRSLAEFTIEELRLFDQLLNVDDPVIDDWIRGREGVPRLYDHAVLAALRRFCLADRRLGRDG